MKRSRDRRVRAWLTAGSFLLGAFIADTRLWAAEGPAFTATPVPKHRTTKRSASKKKPVKTKKPFHKATPTPSAVPTGTATATSSLTPTPTVMGKAIPTSTLTPRPVAKAVPGTALPKITTFPNPARGDKLIFRVMTLGPSRAHIVVYDRFFNKVVQLEGEGDRLYDILWNIKKVPEGVYHFQTQVEDGTTGAFEKLPLQNFAVEKDDLSGAQ